MKNSIQKLRIYAMCQRLKELQFENNMKAFMPEPIKYIEIPKCVLPSFRDKKGKLFEHPKSKFHK
jgi:hypothetical protein